MGNTGELLRQGLLITIVGMSLVLGGLGLLWGLIALLSRLFPANPPGPAVQQTGAMPPIAAGDNPTSTSSEAALAATLDAERAAVAALVAGALMANALPIHFEAPVGPAFEHGRTAPSWVTANRARALQPWQPARQPEH